MRGGRHKTDLYFMSVLAPIGHLGEAAVCKMRYAQISAC
ncbi:MAG: hypothetical protein QOJ85_2990 [Solirubrobacteraceae bacterium]|jgi:hypothetical protein|nr:hypothetical protein [Solirubrobacteraceae bacterium]MEA2242920.1 hypothetical protein [Solirubrobacteraceae bacterium]